jgi:hypothetical protein
MLKLVGIIILGIILVFVFIDGVFLKTTYNVDDDVYDEEKEFMSEIQFDLIKAGIKTASSHNMQPWKIEIVDNKNFFLYADMEKSLRIIDKDNRQMLISQGTFISGVKNMAKEMSIDLSVRYYDVDFNDKKPIVAGFKINGGEDIILDAVSSGTFTANSLDKVNEISSIREMLAVENSEFEFISFEDETKYEFQEFLRKGTLIESRDKLAMKELIDVFRFTKWERNKNRYGLFLNTMNPLLRVVIEPILKFLVNWESFGKSSISSFENRLKNENGYILIVKDNPKDKDYIKVGEIMTNLYFKTNGYNIKPAVQLIEDIDGMKAIYKEVVDKYEINGDVVFIIGFTKGFDKYHESLRHKVMDIVDTK